MRRSLMKRSRIKAPKLTEKRARQRDRRKIWAFRVKARDKRCQHRTGRWFQCLRGAGEAHHVLARSQGGTDEMWNGLGLCHDHHMWVHDNRESAQALGLLAHVGDCSELPA